MRLTRRFALSISGSPSNPVEYEAFFPDSLLAQGETLGSIPRIDTSPALPACWEGDINNRECNMLGLPPACGGSRGVDFITSRRTPPRPSPQAEREISITENAICSAFSPLAGGSSGSVNPDTRPLQASLTCVYLRRYRSDAIRHHLPSVTIPDTIVREPTYSKCEVELRCRR